MSAHEDEVIRVVKADATEGNDENSIRNSPDFVDDEVNAIHGTLHALISALIELMDRLIQTK